MFRELISLVLLIVLTCIVLCCSFQTPINRREKSLTVQATLQDGESVDFKLSTVFNRPLIRDSDNELFKWEGKSYNTAKMKPYFGSDCSPTAEGDREFANSLTFPKSNLNVANVNLIASQKPLVSEWFEHNGILGLFPLSLCEEGVEDPNAFINRLRGNNSGYSIDASSLSITNEFPKNAANSPFDGLIFDISCIFLDEFIFTDSIVGVVDLHSNAIKVPAKIFDQLLDSLSISKVVYSDEVEGSKFISFFDLKLKQFKIELSEGPIVEFPPPKFWNSMLVNYLNDYFPFYEISTVFVPHDKEYWSFGLKFLDVCKISVDLERRRIYFEQKEECSNYSQIRLTLIALSPCLKSQRPMLFDLVPNLDELPPLQLEWQADHAKISTIFKNPTLSDAQITDRILALNDSPSVTRALLYGALCEAETDHSLKAFRWLTLTVTDDYQCFTFHLTRLIQEAYPKLRSPVRERLFWLFKCAVEHEIPGTAEIGYCLLRCIKPASISEQDVSLCLDLLGLFKEHKEWLYKCPMLVASSCYVFLRLIPEHVQVAHLSELEIDFCLMLLKEQFLHCLKLGRDLVRSLMAVSRIMQFDEFLTVFLTEPQKLNPNLQSILQVLSIPPNKRVIAARLSIEMERKLYFIMEKVRLGSQKYYQSWFSSLYTSTKAVSGAGELVIPDLIRFLLYAFPDGAFTLQCTKNPFVPRWAMIGWLLKSARSYSTAASCKLALFWDWFFFEPQNDDVLQVLEPAFSFILNSTRKYPKITNSLVEFAHLFQRDFFGQFAGVIQAKLHLSSSLLLQDKEASKEEFLSIGKLLEPAVMEMFCQVFGVSIQPEKLKTQTIDLIDDEQPDVETAMEDEENCSLQELPSFVHEDEEEHEASFDSPVVYLTRELNKFLDISLSDTESFFDSSQALLNWLKGESITFDGYIDKITTKLCELISLEHSTIPLSEISRMNVSLFVVKFAFQNYIAAIEEIAVIKRLDLIFLRLFTSFPAYRAIVLCILAAYPNERDFEDTKEQFLFTNGTDNQWIEALLQVKTMNLDYFYGMVHMFLFTFPFLLSGNVVFWRGVLQDADPAHLLVLRMNLPSMQAASITSPQQLAYILTASLGWESWEQIFLWSLLSPLMVGCSWVVSDEAFCSIDLNSFFDRLDWAVHSEALTGLFTLIEGYLRQNTPFPLLQRLLLWPDEECWQSHVHRWFLALFTRLLFILCPIDAEVVEQWCLQLMDLVLNASFDEREFVSGRVGTLLMEVDLPQNLLTRLEEKMREVAQEGNSIFAELVMRFYDQ